jgi:hypothetical protein
MTVPMGDRSFRPGSTWPQRVQTADPFDARGGGYPKPDKIVRVGEEQSVLRREDQRPV